jgi:hypothetical protein
VARHLGLSLPEKQTQQQQQQQQRRAHAPTSPGVSVNMADEDVAAMLMALPLGTPLNPGWVPPTGKTIPCKSWQAVSCCHCVLLNSGD